ncbi:MAG: citramalate synthase [Myxococcales bacterium]|nr:citramalate synthase [Myxococcales bacterium]
MLDVHIYDTTLRDSSRGEGFHHSVPERLAFVEVLDDLGLPFIEVGRPGLDPRDAAFVNRVAPLKLRNASLAVSGPLSVTPACEQDPGLAALIACDLSTVTISSSVWRTNLAQFGGWMEADHIQRVRSSLAFVKPYVDNLLFDAEHFFDAYIEDPDFTLEVIRAAIDGGATRVVLCDNNGGMLPYHLQQILTKVSGELDIDLGIRCHNDGEMAVANSIMAVHAGATLIKGAINGYGPRCGVANLSSVIPSLELKMGRQCLPEHHLRLLTRVARTVQELSNHAPWPSQPYVGRTAFAHRSGAALGAARRTGTFEHVDPESVGNQRRVLAADPDGRANVMSKLTEYGLYLSPEDPRTHEIVEKVCQLETQGWQFEGAEASFRLLVNEALGLRKKYFDLLDMSVKVSLGSDLDTMPGRAEAFVRLDVGGVKDEARAEGNGPIHAMDAALRKIVHHSYPALRSVRLVDYKVRILSSGVGTESVGRVLVQWGDGDELWGTVGVSTNIIHASWRALVDALEYKLMKDGVEPLSNPNPVTIEHLERAE